MSVSMLVGLAAACSSQSGEGDESSSSGDSGSSGHAGPSTSAGATTDRPEDTGVDGASTSIATETATDGSTGVDTEPDAYDGDWCGNASTGRLELGAVGIMPFSGVRDAPNAFVGWVTVDDAIQVAVYDVADADWDEPETLFDTYETIWGGEPAGAVDGEGNAFVGYVRQDPEPHAVVHRFDAVTGSWTSQDLPGALISPWSGGISTSAEGHAVLFAFDMIDRGYHSQPWVWFYDPVTELWSDPFAAGGPTSGEPLVVAQDDESGDAVILLRDEADEVLALYHDAATGELTSTSLSASGYPAGIVQLDDGEFLALTSTSAFEQDGDIHAHRHANGAWGAAETIASGSGLSPVRLVTDGNGRAVASWNDQRWGVYARRLDGDNGWDDLLVVNPTNPSSLPWWADHRAALDDQGFTIAFSTFGDSGDIRTWARRYEDGEGTPAFELAPDQPTDSRIVALQSIGTDRVRAVWEYAGETTFGGYAYACHTPVSGWSEPVVTPDYIRTIERRRDGETLVVGILQDYSAAYVDYYSAP